MSEEPSFSSCSHSWGYSLMVLCSSFSASPRGFRPAPIREPPRAVFFFSSFISMSLSLKSRVRGPACASLRRRSFLLSSRHTGHRVPMRKSRRARVQKGKGRRYNRCNLRCPSYPPGYHGRANPAPLLSCYFASRMILQSFSSGSPSEPVPISFPSTI